MLSKYVFTYFRNYLSLISNNEPSCSILIQIWKIRLLFSTITWINRKTISWNHSCTLNCNTMRLLKSFTLSMSKPSNYKKETNSTIKTKWRTIPKISVRLKSNIPSKRHIFKACNIYMFNYILVSNWIDSIHNLCNKLCMKMNRCCCIVTIVLKYS